MGLPGQHPASDPLKESLNKRPVVAPAVLGPSGLPYSESRFFISRTPSPTARTSTRAPVLLGSCPLSPAAVSLCTALFRDDRQQEIRLPPAPRVQRDRAAEDVLRPVIGAGVGHAPGTPASVVQLLAQLPHLALYLHALPPARH